MRNLSIILSLCFLGTFVAADVRDEDAIACAKELKLDTSDLEKDTRLENFTDDQKHCLIACMVEKKQPGVNIHEHLLKKMTQNGVPIPEPLKKTMEECKAKDGCDYLKCVNIFSGPYAEKFVVNGS